MKDPTSTFYPVYLLYGTEDYLIEEEIQRLLNRTLTQKEKGFNFHQFNGEEHDAQEIVQTAQTLPMFSPYRFVLVRKVDSMNEDQAEALKKYIQNPSPHTCLVLYGQTLGPWKRYQKEIDKVGKVIEYDRLKGKALVAWLKNRMKEKGKTISEEAANYLMEIVGDHLYDLDQALEKVFLRAGERQQVVDLKDVEEMTVKVKISTVFDLTDAIGNRDLNKALGILEKILETKAIPFRKEGEESKFSDPIPFLLSMMAKQYWNMLVIKRSHLQDFGGLSRELRISPWSIKKLIEQGRNFSEGALHEGILKCHQTDLAIKRSRGPKDLLIEKLIIDLCQLP